MFILKIFKFMDTKEKLNNLNVGISIQRKYYIVHNYVTF